jgi:hypothetical protein
VIERPEYLIPALGTHPERPSERQTGERAAMRIEGYRQEFARGASAHHFFSLRH